MVLFLTQKPLEQSSFLAKTLTGEVLHMSAARWIEWPADLDQTSFSFDRGKPSLRKRGGVSTGEHISSLAWIYIHELQCQPISLDLNLKSCYLVVFTYLITQAASVDLLKQCSCDKVAGQMEILEEERGLPDGEGEEWSVQKVFLPRTLWLGPFKMWLKWTKEE